MNRHRFCSRLTAMAVLAGLLAACDPQPEIIHTEGPPSGIHSAPKTIILSPSNP